MELHPRFLSINGYITKFDECEQQHPKHFNISWYCHTKKTRKPPSWHCIYSTILWYYSAKMSWQYNIACNTKIWVPQQMFRSGCLFHTTILYLMRSSHGIIWRKKKSFQTWQTDKPSCFHISIHERGKGKRVSSANKTQSTQTKWLNKGWWYSNFILVYGYSLHV